ncbi:MAG: endonuclease MutS2 [Oscillospiraceae bacterium]|nr:endonuclease MutS2 [Oscillospiraceae bacterium]
MTIHEKSLITLELPRVLDLAANFAASDAARELLRAVRPSTDKIDVQVLQKETSDAKAMTETRQSPGFVNLSDIRSSAARAKLGGLLTPRELLNIAQTLRETREVYNFGEGSSNSLSPRFWALRPNRFLEDRINSVIVSEDEIADNASSELNAIRRHIRAANAKVREILQKIVSSSSYSKALQESIVTQRGGRFVIPVKAEHRSSLPGIVHDSSSSGATLFVEPMGVVSANNEIRELESKEKREIERILYELAGETANFAEQLTENLQLLTELDVIFARAKLSYNLNCCEPELSADDSIVLRRARHPLLGKDSAVPIDITLGKTHDVLVITGPNTGGKTVSIKTIGLLCAMTACGLHIPAADGCSVPVFSQILADIGDEQSIEQSLSTFSSHMTNIVGILEAVSGDSLILLDELGAGTDPAEGAALAVSIIEHLRQRGAKLAVTTHYAELKLYALQTSGVENASCEFDVETLKPTYRLITGIPGKSNAFAISERLGLSREIIRDAENRVDSGSAEFEAVIATLQEKRQAMEREEQSVEILKRKIEADSKDLDKLRSGFENERAKAQREARKEAQSIIDDARAAAKEALKLVKEKPADAFGLLNIAESAAAPEFAPIESEAPSRAVKAGDTVELLRYGTKAEVLTVKGDSLELKAGILTVKAKLNEVRLIENAGKTETAKYLEASEAALKNLAIAHEVDLRGLDASEALSVMERYLDSAQMAHLSSVTIIHGKGTGALRKAVQAALKRDSRVKSQRPGNFGEGDAGVTIAELA